MHQCLCQKFVKNLFVSSACSILFSIYLLMRLELQHFLRNKLAAKVDIMSPFRFFFMSCEIFPSEKIRTGEVPSVRANL